MNIFPVVLIIENRPVVLIIENRVQELRVETYLLSLIATGTARPAPPESSLASVYPPKFAAAFVGPGFPLPPSFSQSSDAAKLIADAEMDVDIDMTDAVREFFSNPLLYHGDRAQT